MAKNFKNMSKSELRSHAANTHNRAIPDHDDFRVVLIETLKLRPQQDSGNITHNSGINLTRFEDNSHSRTVEHTEACDVVENYLEALGSYDPVQQGDISRWLTVNCAQLFSEHCFSHGPNEDRTEYWITISGDTANVQWILTS